MWVKDAIVKALGDVVGKIATGVQGVLAEELRGLVWREVRFGEATMHPVLMHLREKGSLVYQSGVCVYDCGYRVPVRALYRYKEHFVCIVRDGKEVSLYFSKALDFNKLRTQALTNPPSVYKGTHDGKTFDWFSVLIEDKDLQKGKEYIALESDLRKWLIGETIFRKAGLPHRRGWLLYGKPGNGKTTAIQKLAASNSMDISIPLWHKGRLCQNLGPGRGRKYFLLIEDIDTIFQGREALNTDANFGNFLNSIDGVDNLDDCVVVVTTNDLSAIDPALGRPRDETQWNSLSTRPGRIDRCIYFDNPDHEARLGIARKMLPEDEAARLAGEGDGLSVAQFSAIVRERAMEVLSEIIGQL